MTGMVLKRGEGGREAKDHLGFPEQFFAGALSTGEWACQEA
jgi:hypothetical protein